MDDPTSGLQAQLAAFLDLLPPELRAEVRHDEPLWRYTTLRVGGPADLYYAAHKADDLAAVAVAAQRAGLRCFMLGGGSNVCISDRGIRGLVLHNLCDNCVIGPVTHVDAGYPFMRLFLRTAQAGLSGLEFAVGIPGSVGGALVSNAGAYRQSICDLVVQLDVVEDGERKMVPAEWMGFSYRDSRLRRPGASPAALVSVDLKMTPKPRAEIMAVARENQRQRIYKQPWFPSAGSFFKNVYDRELAARLPDLPAPMKEAGVVPAGYLNSAADCKGLAVGGAQVSMRHGNFVVNRGGASANDIRALAQLIRERVREAFGVELQEEVLYAGEW